MRTRGFGLTDVGAVRTNNEDWFGVADDLGLYVVCDGLGGHAAGEIAAQLAGRVAVTTVQRSRSVAESGNLAGILEHAARRASKAVAAASHAVGRAGMGCTLTGLLVQGRSGAMVHVGDTRLYRLRDGVLELMSSDHTLAGDMVRRGAMTARQARGSALSRALTRCIGADAAVQADIRTFGVRPRDRFLLCSDGLSDHLESDAELAKFLAAPDPSTIAADLVRLANTRGGSDNITAVVVVVDPVESPANAEFGENPQLVACGA